MYDPGVSARTESRRVVDVEIAGGSTLRVALAEDGKAGPVLIVAHGFGGGEEPFRRPDYCGAPIRLPASILPQLRQALEVLAEDAS